MNVRRLALFHEVGSPIMLLGLYQCWAIFNVNGVEGAHHILSKWWLWLLGVSKGWMLLWMILNAWFWFLNRYVCLSRLLFFIFKIVNRDCWPSLPFLLLLWRLLCATWQGQFNIDGRMCPYAWFLEILIKVEQAPIQRGVYIQIECILW